MGIIPHKMPISPTLKPSTPISIGTLGERDTTTPLSRAEVITAFRKKVVDESLGSRRHHTSHIKKRNKSVNFVLKNKEKCS